MNFEDEKELLNIDLSALKVEPIPRQARFLEVLNTANKLLEETFGKDFDQEKFRDINGSVFFAFPRWKNLETLPSILFYNIWGFMIDDHLEKFPQGELNVI